MIMAMMKMVFKFKRCDYGNASVDESTHYHNMHPKHSSCIHEYIQGTKMVTHDIITSDDLVVEKQS